MILDKITNLLINLEIDDIENAIKEALLDKIIDPLDIFNALKKGMEEVGNRYEMKDYYLAELMLAGETMNKALQVIKPALFQKENIKKKEKVVICSVKGDLHEIGKNLLGILLLSSGFNVIDLGVDVGAETIVMELKKSGAKMVALSSLLSMTVREIENVHEALIKAGLRKSIKIIVGGAPLNMELAKRFGADNYADDVISGVKQIEQYFNKQI